MPCAPTYSIYTYALAYFDWLLANAPRYVFQDGLLHARTGMLRGSMVEFIPRELVPTPHQLLAMDRDAFALAGEEATPHVHDQRAANYASAWALVHTLKLGDADMRRRLFGYLETVSRGELAPEDAWTQHFHDVNLDSVVQRHLKAVPSDLDLAFVPLEHPPPTVRTLEPGAVALHWAWLTSLVAPERTPEYTRRAEAHAETRAEAHLISALALLRATDGAGAKRKLRSGLDEDPTNGALLSLLLELEIGAPASQRHAEIAALATRLRAVAERAEAFVALTHHDLVSGNVGAAIGDSLRAVTLRPQGPRCWAARARALGAAEQWPAALRAVQRARNLLPHEASSLTRQLEELERILREAATEGEGRSQRADSPAR